jgi:hypothetical protein
VSNLPIPFTPQCRGGAIRLYTYPDRGDLQCLGLGLCRRCCAARRSRYINAVVCDHLKSIHASTYCKYTRAITPASIADSNQTCPLDPRRETSFNGLPCVSHAKPCSLWQSCGTHLWNLSDSSKSTTLSHPDVDMTMFLGSRSWCKMLRRWMLETWGLAVRLGVRPGTPLMCERHGVGRRCVQGCCIFGRPGWSFHAVVVGGIPSAKAMGKEMRQMRHHFVGVFLVGGTTRVPF